MPIQACQNKLNKNKLLNKRIAKLEKRKAAAAAQLETLKTEKKSIAFALSALFACAGAQAANQIEVHGRGLHALSPAEAKELQGRYALVDGRMLEVSRTIRRIQSVWRRRRRRRAG